MIRKHFVDGTQIFPSSFLWSTVMQFHNVYHIQIELFTIYLLFAYSQTIKLFYLKQFTLIQVILHSVLNVKLIYLTHT